MDVAVPDGDDCLRHPVEAREVFLPFRLIPHSVLIHPGFGLLDHLREHIPDTGSNMTENNNRDNRHEKSLHTDSDPEKLSQSLQNDVFLAENSEHAHQPGQLQKSVKSGDLEQLSRVTVFRVWEEVLERNHGDEIDPEPVLEVVDGDLVELVLERVVFVKVRGKEVENDVENEAHISYPIDDRPEVDALLGIRKRDRERRHDRGVNEDARILKTN